MATLPLPQAGGMVPPVLLVTHLLLHDEPQHTPDAFVAQASVMLADDCERRQAAPTLPSTVILPLVVLVSPFSVAP